ncbi:hypothetical protein PPL_01686 [Heterostelium album PN500]|uniref:Ankyrin repeat protein n=1 Tax=Heterostelium pallidum (strain ATCC 26659 / Pp 5 / PN500) TaxID=670386 RepID=D3B070_HETP5|nr:hypothetical protein PPL_01686 [Heterostelium album PN500]EFA84694.1 hypothetical protein PPL_01686 [Heterostelium album PN500]|eukprot:XP_020436807.1 hypothetical protein PPL_01686 [Heterostelium album PN500]
MKSELFKLEFNNLVIRSNIFNKFQNKEVYGGHVQIIDWLINNRTDRDDLQLRNGMIGIALNKFQKHIPDWLLSNGYIEDREYEASELGFKFSLNDLYQWLSTTKIRINFTSNDFDEAARKSSLDVVKWINDHNNQGCSKSAMYNAFTRCKFETVRWLHENRTEGTHTICLFSQKSLTKESEKSQTFEMVKWYHQNRTEGFSHGFMDFVASFSLDIVKFLHQNRSEGCTNLAMFNAGLAGQLEIFKFLKENRTEGVSSDLIGSLCYYGQLEMIQYLYETGKPNEYNWSFNLMDLAIKSSNLDLVKWINQNTTHVSTTINVFDNALSRKDFEMIQYLIDSKLYSNDLESSIISQLKNQSLFIIEIVDWLMKSSILDHDKLVNLAKQSNIPIIYAFLKDYNINI